MTHIAWPLESHGFGAPSADYLSSPVPGLEQVHTVRKSWPGCIIGHSRQPMEVCYVAGFNAWKELDEKLTLDNNWNILTWGIAGQCLLLSSSTQWAEAVCQQTLLHPFNYHRYDVEDDALQYLNLMMIYSCAKKSQFSHLKSWACITRPGNLSTPGKVGTWGVE